MSSNACDIIIPVFNSTGLTRNCIESIYNNTNTPFNLIFIDNGSGKETMAYLEELSTKNTNVKVVRNNENLGWVRAVNQGMRLSVSPYICIMNNDTVVKTHSWLETMIDVAESSSDIGLVNPKFKAKDKAPDDKAYAEIDFCRGYCVLIKRTVIDAIGVLDEAFGMGYYDDDDYSVRAIRAGFRCVQANSVEVEHLGDSTFRDVFEENKRLELHEKNKKLFYSKWGRRLRLVFVIDDSIDRDRARELLLTVARRQHIVYLWNSGKPLTINHINIKERRLLAPILSADLLLNRFKSPDKRYDAIFRGDIDNKVIDRIDSISRRNTPNHSLRSGSGQANHQQPATNV